MNIHATTIRRGIATAAATAAFFSFAACGDIPTPTQDIGGTQEQKKTTPPSPTKTSPTRGDFRDENGTAGKGRPGSGQKSGQKSDQKSDQKSGKQRPGEQRDRQSYDPIDRSRDWH